MSAALGSPKFEDGHRLLLGLPGGVGLAGVEHCRGQAGEAFGLAPLVADLAAHGKGPAEVVDRG
jgi:hypothetical protein